MKRVLAFIIGIFFLSVTPLLAVDELPLKMYVRQGCTHCAKVKEFLNTNNLKDKVTELETYNNTENQKMLDEEFKKYDVPNEQRGVPFMVVSDTEYLVGDQPIIQYFADKYNIKVEDQSYQSSPSDTIFLVLGGTVLYAVLGYGLYSVFKKN